MKAYIKKSLVFEAHHLDTGHDVKVLHKYKTFSKIEVVTMGKTIIGSLENKYLVF